MMGAIGLPIAILSFLLGFAIGSRRMRARLMRGVYVKLNERHLAEMAELEEDMLWLEDVVVRQAKGSALTAEQSERVSALLEEDDSDGPH